MSHWLYNGNPLTEVPEKAFGFVYQITNKKSGRKYIGRKQFGSTRRKPLTKKQKEAGRKKRTVIRSESDWREYTGSNTQLNKDIAQHGKDNFLFEILILGNTKGQVNYMEENVQHKCNVLFDDTYYNDSIGARKFISVKFSNELVENIKKVDKIL